MMNSSIQKNIWILAGVVLFIMITIWISLTTYNNKMQSQYNHILERYLTLNEVSSLSQEIVTDLNHYFLDYSATKKESLYKNKTKMIEVKAEVATFRNIDNDFAFANYGRLIDSFIATMDRAILLRTEDDTEDYQEALSEATSISMYISEMTLDLIDTELKTYYSFYHNIIDRSEELKVLGVRLLMLITLLLVLFTYWFSKRITTPLQQLTLAASELSKGRFDLKVEVDSNDEISFLAKTFDRMRININNYLVEIQQKAQLANELQKNKLLLQESQLHSLQSQINPHFLFNTLDTLSKKAYLEGSEETSDLLVSVADLLRYNLRNMDRSTHLSDEVEILFQYMEIQKARFTERLQFYTEIDPATLHLPIPRLTLQPIVENAIIHAIEPQEDGGVIWFRTKNEVDRITIEVEDNGPGMSEERIKQVLEDQNSHTEGHSTGIGVINVVNRLIIFYGYDDLIHIESVIDKGTKVVLSIPKKRRNEHD